MIIQTDCSLELNGILSILSITQNTITALNNTLKSNCNFNKMRKSFIYMAQNVLNLHFNTFCNWFRSCGWKVQEKTLMVPVNKYHDTCVCLMCVCVCVLFCAVIVEGFVKPCYVNFLIISIWNRGIKI